MLNEHDILKLIKTKSPKTFCCLYDEYSPALYGLIIKFSPDATTAGGILQKTFLHIWQNINSYNAANSSLLSWMVSITIQQCSEILNLQKNELLRKLIAKGISKEPDRYLHFETLFSDN